MHGTFERNKTIVYTRPNLTLSSLNVSCLTKIDSHVLLCNVACTPTLPSCILATRATLRQHHPSTAVTALQLCVENVAEYGRALSSIWCPSTGFSAHHINNNIRAGIPSNTTEPASETDRSAAGVVAECGAEERTEEGELYQEGEGAEGRGQVGC